MPAVFVSAYHTPAHCASGRQDNPTEVVAHQNGHFHPTVSLQWHRKIRHFAAVSDTTAKRNPTKYRIFFDISWGFSGAREGTRTPKDKPHAPQTCASASSATLAYSVRAALRTSEVGSRLCGLLEYSTTFAGNRQAFFGFFIDFFGVHILIEPTKIQKQRAREVLACVCLYHVCGECF